MNQYIIYIYLLKKTISQIDKIINASMIVYLCFISAEIINAIIL